MNQQSPAKPTHSASTPMPSPSWSDRLLSRLARRTSSNTFIPEIDGLRTIAVMAVVLFHLDQEMGSKAPGLEGASRALAGMVRCGFFGVPLFFAISAFIVSFPFARHRLGKSKPVDIQRFYLRRITRLEPPYVLNLLLVWLLGAVLFSGRLTDQLPGLLTSLVYQHNLVFGRYSGLNAAAWSLEVEFQFYLLAPVLTTVFAVRPAWLRRTLIIGSALAVVWLRHPDNRRIALSLPGHLEFFAVGFLVVDIYLTEWSGCLPRRFVWDFVGLTAWFAIVVALRLPHTAFQHMLLSALLVVAMLGSMGGGCLSRLLGNRWVCTFGGMCYSYYLYHQLIQARLVPAFAPFCDAAGPYWARFAAQFALTFPVIVAACTLLFMVAEKPFMQRDWPVRLAAKIRKRPVGD